MIFFSYFRVRLALLAALLIPVAPILAAPLTGLAPGNETNAYGEDIYPDNDITDDQATDDEKKKLFKNARMAFLFGQYKLAYAGWEPLANDGYANAQATIAWMYHTGKGVKKNLRTAHYWYTRAANQSHVIAKNNLGVFYEQGLGVRTNLQRAALMYRDAAELGYSFAQYNLGMLYHDGRGVKKNMKEAIFWLEIAALQGVSQAQEILESMGRQVKIPQHQVVNENLSEKKDRPRWHRRSSGSKTIPASKRRDELTKDIYTKHRQRLAAVAQKPVKRNTPRKTEKPKPAPAAKASAPEKHDLRIALNDTKTNRPTETQDSEKQQRHSKLSARTRALLERNRALIAKSANGRKDKSRKTTTAKAKVSPAKGKHAATTGKRTTTTLKTKPARDAERKTASHKKNNRPTAQNKLAYGKLDSSNVTRLLASNWIKKQNPKRYTLQIAGSDDLNKLKSLVTLLGKQGDAAYFKTRMKGKRWYSLIYGVYPTRSAAQKKIKNLPHEIKRWSPWIRRFSEVQAKIATAK